MRKTHVAALRAAGMVVFISQLLFQTTLLWGQTVWPGDINNNGIVNGVDVLYHAVAEGTSGAARNQTGADWAEHTAPAAWSGTFTDGINYHAADVDGLGAVDQQDRDALWKNNYGQTHGTVVPDAFLIGDAENDPELSLEAVQGDVMEGETLELKVSLGDAEHPVTNFYGISFKVHFAAEFVKDELTAPLWNPNAVRLELNNDSWLNGVGGASAESFVRLNNEAGELEVVIINTGPMTTDGHGEIASLMVIIEDIVFLQDENTDITVSEIKLIDDQLQETPVAGSTDQITILETTFRTALQGQPEHSSTASTQGSLNIGDPNGAETNEEEPSLKHTPRQAMAEQTNEPISISVYPNPFVETVTVSGGTAVELQSVRVISSQGQTVLETILNSDAATQLELGHLPAGNYFLQLTSTAGTIVRQITK